jgi:hypothetical protein
VVRVGLWNPAGEPDPVEGPLPNRETGIFYRNDDHDGYSGGHDKRFV